jgi:DNA-binding MarR family transcriptional regulator
MGSLIGAHSTLMAELNARLVSEHGLTISEYEVLLLLSRAPERSLRGVDLAREVRLSPSGITRMVDRLAKAGLIGKRACESDARARYAVLTDAGLAKLDEAAPGHIETVERLLADRLDQDELATLNELLGRLSAEDLDCSTDAAPPPPP